MPPPHPPGADEGALAAENSPAQRLDQLLHRLPVGVVTLTRTGEILGWNVAAAHLLGREEADLSRQPLAEMFADPQRVSASITAAGKGSSPEVQELLVAEHVVRLQIPGAKEDELSLVALLEDVTETRLAERRRSAYHEVVEILATAPDVSAAALGILEAVCVALDWKVGSFWIPDGKGLRCIELWLEPGTQAPAFEAATRTTTLPPSVGLPGTVWTSGRAEWIPDLAARADFPRAPAAMQDGLHGAFAFPITLASRVLGVMEFLASDVREPDEELLQIMQSVGGQVGQFMERRRAEDAVRLSDARKSAILDSALDCIISMDHRGVITEFNPAAERTFGYEREEVIGRYLADVIVPPALREAHWSGLRRYLESGRSTVLDQHLELTGVHRDGSEFPVELAITRVDLPGPPLFTGYLRDITQRKEAEEVLLRSRRELLDTLVPPASGLPSIPGTEIAVEYQAGEGEVGGDFYEIFERAPDDWVIVMGDVCGRGSRAARLTALVRYSIRALAVRDPDPVSVLRGVSAAIRQQGREDMFCTAVHIRLRAAEHGMAATVAVAGHPLPLRRSASGVIETVGHPGSLLGIFEDTQLRPVEVLLVPGDLLLLYTDGVTEARTPEGFFGIEGVTAALGAGPETDPRAVVRRLTEALRAVAQGPARDDAALLALRIL